MIRPDTFESFKTTAVTGLVVVRVEKYRLALRLEAVERVVRAVAVTPLPNAPAVVLGIIDVEGQVIPVFDARRRFSLPSRQVGPDDHLLIARAGQGRAALLIDRAEGVIERQSSDIVAATPFLADLEHVHGVVRLDDGLVVIHDLDRFLSAEEVAALDEAMRRASSGH